MDWKIFQEFVFKKAIILAIVCIVVSSGVRGQILKTFPLSSVHVLANPFKRAQQTDLHYLLELKADRLLAPYRREAGLMPRDSSYGNWENTGLDGHIGGHYLSALSFMYAATGNQRIKARIDYFLAELSLCQQATGNGYIGGVPGSKELWSQIQQGKIDAATFSLNGKWVPLYNIHKLFSGLYDAYTITGNLRAKEMLIKMTNWFQSMTLGLTDAQAQLMMRSEHGGLNEVFANVYALTGQVNYLNLAKKFSHKAILDPLIQRTDALTGIHANTQIPKVIGFERIAQLSGDTAWDGAAAFFWSNVVHRRTVSIGGNSVREHFNPTNNFASMLEAREGPETCNSYNMLKLTKELFLAHPSASFMDYYERTLYNHILSSQRQEGGFVYFTPIRPGHYRTYSDTQKSFWCCVGSGMENHGKYGELIYAHTNEDLYVNLYLASDLSWKEKGVKITQRTGFPFSQASKITTFLPRPKRLALHFRYPSWIDTGQMTIRINGIAQKVVVDKKGFIRIERQWKNKDVVDVGLPMHTYKEVLPDGSKYVSFLRGPIVLAADLGKEDLVDQTADGSRMGHIARGPLWPLDDAPLIVSSGDQMEDLIRPTADPMVFSADQAIYQSRFKNLKLVPFYTLENTRYILYWPFTSSEQLPELVAVMKRKETAARKLDSLTIDWVATGEQQPENDHNFQGIQTEAGVFAERHYRRASGWFSYHMKNTRRSAKTLRLTYYGTDHDRKFFVYVNGTLLRKVELNGQGQAGFMEADYSLPPEARSAQTLEVKFVADDGSTVGNIFEVRLLQ